MSGPLSRKALLPALTFVGLAGFAQAAHADPLLVTYGRDAPALEGDHDHAQVIHIAVPETETAPVFVRLFDPDAGGAHDTIFGTSWPVEGDTQTRFAVYGGDGAYALPESPRSASGGGDRTSGTLLAEAVFGDESAYDDRWHTLTRLDPQAGELREGMRVFRLVVEGLSGDDGNVYDVFISADADDNRGVAGSELYSFVPTVRVPMENVLSELRFTVPLTGERLEVHHFDVSGADVAFETNFRSVPVETSGQGSWGTSEILLEDQDMGRDGALIVRGGAEIPNDVTLYASDSSGALVPMLLPVRTFERNSRPVAELEVTPLNCSMVELYAGGSRDQDGEDLAFVWRFHDGRILQGDRITRTYLEPGTYPARLEVTDASGQVANGMAVDFDVFIKRQPVARGTVDAVVATDVQVYFDGSTSEAEGQSVARHVWSFDDGRVIEGERISRSFREPGEHTVRLDIEDDSGHPCSRAATELHFRVNAPPLAEAGDNVYVAVGETVMLDAGASHDPDGVITAYRWDLGDGAREYARRVAHAYERPGTYEVSLEIADDAGVANSGARDTLTVVVNAQPTADAGDDRLLAVGDVLTLDGTHSRDSDGTLIAYRWDLGNGAQLSGPIVQYSYDAPGTYEVTVTVEDDSSLSNATASDSATIVVNARPQAEAGLEQRVAVNEAIVFDGSASRDPDGGDLAYVWNFGDGGWAHSVTAEHAYAEPGEYLARLTVSDGTGVANDSATDTVRVVVNAPPLAEAGADVTLFAGELYRFDGRGSSDADGNITLYQWSFGDGGAAEGPLVIHSFAEPGTYEVTLTVTDDSLTRDDHAADSLRVVVTDPPNEAPIAEAGDDVTAIVGELIRFDAAGSSDRDGNLVAYSWDFGDGATVEGAEAAYAYPHPGRYEVTLTVRDDSRLANDLHSDTLQVTVLDRPNAAPVALAGADLAVAVGETITFDGSASADPDGNLIVFDWEFGDGAEALGPVVRHAYNASGTYDVRLSVRDDSGLANQADDDALRVFVNEPPVAEAGASQHVTLGEVAFDGTGSGDSDGVLIRYAWDFGDGGSGIGPRPVHVYREPGTYEVTLTVSDDSGTSTAHDSDTTTIIVNATPIADAGPDIIASPGESIVFSGNQSLDPDGRIADFLWDFRDGTTETGATVVHSFEEPGTYYVRLSIQDDTGHGGAVDYAQTTVFINAEPVADAGPDLRVAPGEEVTFDATRSFDSDGDIVLYRWDFSDRSGGVEQAVAARSFDTPGSYRAQVTVIDDSGALNNRAEDELSIFVNSAPLADAGRYAETADLTIVFDGSASADPDGDGLTYRWDFGDGATGEGARAVHTYETGGTYRVTLQVDDGSGLSNSTDSHTTEIRINRPPLADAGEPIHACTNDIVKFNGGASDDPDGGVLRYSWDFGDGTGSDLIDPSRRFEIAGVYPVTLTVEDEAGLANSTHTDRISVRIDQAPVAEAGPDIVACTNMNVQFDGTASSDIDGVVNRYTWDFGDGFGGAGDRPMHAYRRPGQYRAVLSIEGDQLGRCDNVAYDEVLVTVLLAPIAEISAPSAAAIGETVRFDGSASSYTGGDLLNWYWDFGDGASGEGAMVEHVFDTPGSYRVSLRLESDTEAADCRFIEAFHLVHVNEPPVAVAGEDRHVGVGEEVLFDAVASHDPDGGIAIYSWDFGDGTSAQGVQVLHVYRAPGTYEATLKVIDDSDTTSATSSDTVEVVVNAAPVANAGADLVGAPGEELAFSAGASEDPDSEVSSFLWEFGDGTSAEGRDVVHAYAEPGIYHARLSVTDASGLRNAVTFTEKTVFINDAPTAVAGPDVIAGPNDVVTLDGSGSFDHDGALAAYGWRFPNGSAIGEGVTTNLSFAEPGNYQAVLVVTDDSGAINDRDEDVVNIRINSEPVADAGEDMHASDLTIAFDASGSGDADNDALTYRWDFGDGNFASGMRAVHTYETGGNYPVTLSVDDGTGVHNAKDRDAITVRINRTPRAVAGVDKRACTNDVVLFDASGSIDEDGGVLTYAWDFGDGVQSDTVNPVKGYEEPGTYPVTLTVDDGTGLPNARHTDRVVVRIDQAPEAVAGPDIEACVNVPVAFDGSASIDLDGVVNSYAWDFGDGNGGAGDRPEHTYTEVGHYAVTLAIEGDQIGNCSSSATDEVMVNVIESPIAHIVAPLAGEVGKPVRFDGGESSFGSGRITGYRWDFDDGGAVAEGPEAEHVFAEAGTYNVTLTLESDASVETCRVVSDNHQIIINAPPLAEAGPDRTIVVGEEVVLSAAASSDPDGGIVRYAWDFGDGATGEGIEVRHAFRTAGTYDVALTIVDDAGLDNSTARDTVRITVEAPPGPDILGPAVACAGDNIAWRTNVSERGEQFTWLLGEGRVIEGLEAARTYAREGRYDVTLLAETPDGTERRHSTRHLHVNRTPSAVAGPDRHSCPGEAVTFDGSASLDLDGDLSSWRWDFGDGTVGEGAVVEHAFAAPGIYEVRLTVSDDAGSACSVASDTMQVVVNAPPVAEAGGDREIWIGGANDALMLDGSGSSDADGDALSYFWELGDGTILFGERLRHVLYQGGELPVTLTVNDTSGLSCGTATDEAVITVRERR